MSFEIVGPNGERYELSSVDAFLDEYEPQGFVVAPDQPHWSEVPDIKAVKAEREARASQQVIDLTKLTRAELEAEAANVGIDDPASFPNKAALVDAIASVDLGEHDHPGTGEPPVEVPIDDELVGDETGEDGEQD